MSAIGACVAPFLPQPQRGSALGGIITFYLVATAWATVRRKEGAVGRFEIGALLVAIAAASADVMLGLQRRTAPRACSRAPPRRHTLCSQALPGLPPPGTSP